MGAVMPSSLAQAEHARLVTEAREAGGWTGALVASWAGVTAAEARLDIDCPFGEGEPLLADWWRRGHAQGLDAPVPAATIHRLPLASPTSQQQGAPGAPGKTWTPIPGCTHAAHAAGPDV